MVSRAYMDALAHRHRVLVYARGGEAYARGNPQWDQEFVTWDRRESISTAVDWRQFKRWVLDNQLDLVVFNEQHFWPVVVLSRAELPVWLAAYVDYYTSITVPFFWLYDVLLCNTLRHYSVFRDHPAAFYIPWGTDCGLFTGPCEPVSNTGVVFFHSVGMSPGRKGTRIALEAFHMLRGDLRFVLHTQAPLSADPEVERICRADDRIEVIHRTVPAPGLYHLGDVYVYPSVLEGIGLTIVEALACGLPVITTDVPPMNEFVQHGINGRLVSPAEYRGRFDGYYWAEAYCRPESVAEAMWYYVDERARLPQFKREARTFAQERLDWRKNAIDLSEKLESWVCSARPTRRGLSSLGMRALEYSRPSNVVRRGLRAMLRKVGWEHSKLGVHLLYD